MGSRIRIAFFAVWCIGCAVKPLVVPLHPTAATEPPAIEAITDLGGLPVLSSGGLDRSNTDGRFTPGEWVLISGKHLTDPRARIRIGDHRVPVDSFLSMGLLVRMPRGLPNRDTTLIVTTPRGKSAIPLRPQAYLAISDTVTEEVRFFRTSKDPTAGTAFDAECDSVSFDGARFHVFSQSGAVLYAIPDIASSEAGTSPEIVIIHVGAKDHPQEIGTLPLSTDSAPTAVIGDPDHARFLLLTEHRLLVFDTSKETAPRLSISLALQSAAGLQSEYTAMTLLDHGNRAVLLDSSTNRLTVVDLSFPSPRGILSHLTVTNRPGPRVIQLLPDIREANLLRVIEGPSLKETVGSPVTGPSGPFEPSPTSRIIVYGLVEDRLREQNEIRLPKEAIPLVAMSLADGASLISTVDRNVIDFAEMDITNEEPHRAAELLLNAVQLGQVIKVEANGNTAKLTEGMDLFLSLASLPQHTDIVSMTLHIDVRKFPPSVGVRLSLDVVSDTGAHANDLALRRLSWTDILPPYSLPSISFQ